jgi:uncharacterized membrane protein HdeD (DUF308 family)
MVTSGSTLAQIGNDARTLCRRTWWVFLVGGIAGVAFGILAFMRPLAAWLVVASFFAAFLIVDGIFNVVGAIRNRSSDGWWIMLLIGALGIAVGGYALLNPPVSMVAFVLLVAVQAIVLGVFLLLLGWRIRAASEREWILYTTGVLSVLAGILIIANPAAGGLSVIWVIAAWAIATGILRIVFAFRVRNLPERLAAR